MRTKHPLSDGWSRREFLQATAAGLAGSAAYFGRVARVAAESSQPRACILLWMPGGPSQIDTFDPKPGHANGGPFGAIETRSAGVRICEHLPLLAQQSDRLAILRSMTSKEGDHERAMQFVRTGYPASGPIAYPSLGPLIASQSEETAGDLPPCVTIGANTFFSPGAFQSGYLGPRYSPLQIAPNAFGQNVSQVLRIQNGAPPPEIDTIRQQQRLDMLATVENEFREGRKSPIIESRQLAYAKAVRMMDPTARAAFDVSEEPAALREAYGDTLFGQGCLLARRLVQRGVRFVEVTLNDVRRRSFLGWDTHEDNFAAVRDLCGVLDAGWSALMNDLADHGLLETTTIVWMGEFGRTPRINERNGRDHFPDAWSAVLAGGGIRGGQVIGATDKAGAEIVDRPVTIPDLVSTLLLSLGIDPENQVMSNVGRPIPLADSEAKPIEECLS